MPGAVQRGEKGLPTGINKGGDGCARKERNGIRKEGEIVCRIPVFAIDENAEGGVVGLYGKGVFCDFENRDVQDEMHADCSSRDGQRNEDEGDTAGGEGEAIDDQAQKGVDQNIQRDAVQNAESDKRPFEAGDAGNPVSDGGQRERHRGKAQPAVEVVAGECRGDAREEEKQKDKDDPAVNFEIGSQEVVGKVAERDQGLISACVPRFAEQDGAVVHQVVEYDQQDGNSAEGVDFPGAVTDGLFCRNLRHIYIRFWQGGVFRPRCHRLRSGRRTRGSGYPVRVRRGRYRGFRASKAQTCGGVPLFRNRDRRGDRREAGATFCAVCGGREVPRRRDDRGIWAESLFARRVCDTP